MIDKAHTLESFETMKEKLEISEKYIKELEAILDQSIVGFCVADNQGNIMHVNKAHGRITGTEACYEVGRNLEDEERNGEISSSVTMKVLRLKQPVTMKQDNSNGRSYIVHSSPVFDSHEKIKFVVSNLVDMSDIEKLKSEMEDAKYVSEQLTIQLNQLKTKYDQSSMIVYRSKKMQDIIGTASRIALKNSTVLLLGDSGVGKELVAEFIHMQSPRNNNPFIKINCGAIVENLLETELFGYEPGSFTGGVKEGRKGLLEYADHGTLFLDEIGEMSLNLQVKLLRFLQSHELFRVGGRESIGLDVRIVAATNSNLEQMVQEGTFRKDLYYRLNVVPINVPSLEDRKEDIPILIEHFRRMYNETHSLSKKISPDVVNALMEMKLPGNVRELQHIIERLILLSESDSINLLDFKKIIGSSHASPDSSQCDYQYDMNRIIESKEQEILEKLAITYRSTYEIAKILGISQPTVCRKLNKYGISISK